LCDAAYGLILVASAHAQGENMFEKVDECQEVQFKKATVGENLLNTDCFAFLHEFPLVPVYAENLPNGLIEDEI
jgi:hypothetical protein